MPITIQTCTPGTGFTANCYIITDTTSNVSAIIDPGDCDAALEQLVTGLDVRYILLTHRHFDHICGTARLKALLPAAKVAIHVNDACGLEHGEDSLALQRGIDFIPCMPDILLVGNDILPLGGTNIQVLHTPGHTIGGVCYIIDDNIFSGDTLFCEGIGRLDLPTGNFEAMNASLRALFALKGDYNLFPGHNEATTLAAEQNRGT